MAEQQQPAARSGYPPGHWPAGVHPPGAETFEQTAAVWLFDQVPPDYRLHGVLRRYPVVLARLACEHITACLESARAGYRAARVDLGAHLPAPALDQVMEVYLTEGRRLAATLKEAEALDRALRGAGTDGAPAA
ncbi:hypothetical protein CLV63_12137 [Murinocardiopsis flavida]|uniref:Uncharacterized protein n=1 Tax=Murinocardiopsis flavida TaxID=645275 RepID=A0A2P8D120_9ACTN|nr:hypothetical protein [Murinocardiopsis flavida]PSK90912.1 hypothetical protein CLV63_12137 [Murinocardiopsis flavida]